MSAKRDGASDARRDFLKLAGLTAVTGAALVASAKSAAASEVRDEGATGYRETDHVKTYYKLARF